MTPATIIKRKLELKRQASAVIHEEIQDLNFEKVLMSYRMLLVRRIQVGKFDPGLSARLDAVQALLDRGLYA